MNFSKQISAIFWDNDGVLVDTERIFFAANRQILQSLGIELTESDFIRISLGEGNSVLSLADHLFPDSHGHQHLSQARNQLYSELLANAGPELINPGIIQTLKFFHRKVAMAIVTSCRREHFELIHCRTGILPYMDFILTLEDFTDSKPSPEPYLAALRRSGHHPNDCIVIEDAARGIESAHTAGLEVIAIPNRLSPATGLSAADAIINDASELIYLLSPKEKPPCNR